MGSALINQLESGHCCKAPIGTSISSREKTLFTMITKHMHGLSFDATENTAIFISPSSAERT